MNKNSNTYIIIYATIMVVVVAAVLSFTAISLKPIQNSNVRIEKMGDVLRSIGEGKDANTAPDKAAYITQMYDKYIVDSYAINPQGDVVEGADAFNLLINLKAEYDKAPANRTLPVFVGENAGVKTYIIPVWGVGLWGPVWGYIALDGDWNTIKGIVFDHKSETPGLGAEITTQPFADQFVGQQIFAGDKMVGIAIVKGGAPEGSKNAVDAISGGTLTCKGVESMIIDCLKDYEVYINKQIAAQTSNQTELSNSEQSANTK